MSFRALAGVIGLLAMTASAAAQSPTSGSIAGRVTDSSGGVLQGITVRLSGPAVQGVRTVVTNNEGI